MKRFTATLAAVAVLAGCGSDSGPSLDQQQQAWEEDIERNTCDSWHRVGEDFYTTRESLDALAGRTVPVAQPRLQLPGCSGDTFGRVLHEQLVRQFPDSPKGQAGETTAPLTPQ